MLKISSLWPSDRKLVMRFIRTYNLVENAMFDFMSFSASAFSISVKISLSLNVSNRLFASDFFFSMTPIPFFLDFFFVCYQSSSLVNTGTSLSSPSISFFWVFSAYSSISHIFFVNLFSFLFVRRVRIVQVSAFFSSSSIYAYRIASSSGDNNPRFFFFSIEVAASNCGCKHTFLI